MQYPLQVICSIKEHQFIGKNILKRIVASIITIINPITWAGLKLIFDLYSSLYLTNPPIPDGTSPAIFQEMKEGIKIFTLLNPPFQEESALAFS